MTVLVEISTGLMFFSFVKLVQILHKITIRNGDIKTLQHLRLRGTERCFPDAFPVLKVDHPAERASAAFDACNYG